jgi:hypothetical protein
MKEQREKLQKEKEMQGMRNFFFLTLSVRAACSRFRSSRKRFSFSCRRSGNFSVRVLFRRLTIAFSRCFTKIFLT